MTRPCILDIETNKLGKINNCNLEKKDTLNSYIAPFLESKLAPNSYIGFNHSFPLKKNAVLEAWLMISLRVAL